MCGIFFYFGVIFQIMGVNLLNMTNNTCWHKIINQLSYSMNIASGVHVSYIFMT